MCDKAFGLVKSMDDAGFAGFVEYWYAWCYVFQGDGRKCIEHADSAIRYLQQTQIGLLGSAWTSLGWGYAFLDEMDTALSHMMKGLETAVALGNPLALCFQYSHLAILHLISGDLENARICAERTLELAQKHQNKLWEASGLMVLGSVLGKVDKSRSVEAEQYVLLGMKVSGEVKAKSWHLPLQTMLGEFYVDTGQRQKALETLERTQQMMQEMGVAGYWSARTQKALEKLKAQ